MEVAFTFCLGKTNETPGTEELVWRGCFGIALVLSMYQMAKAAQTLRLGTVYPVWTGIGAVRALLAGILFFHEPATFWRIFFIATSIISIVGLKNVG